MSSERSNVSQVASNPKLVEFEDLQLIIYI